MNSNIILCKGIKLDKEYNNVLSYSTSQMLAICRSTSHRILELNNYSFIGVTNSIITNFTYSQCLQANYIAFQNPRYNNKWFFAFIDKVIYKTDSATQIDFTIDIWTTWFEDWDKKTCYVVREHVDDDTRGLHTVDEGLVTGDYIVNKQSRWLREDNELYTGNDLVIVMGSTQNPTKTVQGGVQTDGIYSGIRYFVFNNNSDGIQELNDWITQFEEAGTADAIKCIFILPKIMTSGADREDHLYAGSNMNVTRYINHGDTENNKSLDLNNNTIDGYVPKNNKVLCYPYNYLLVSNNNGGEVIYKLENFYTNNNNNKTIVNPSFIINCCLTPGGSVRLVPYNYKGINKSEIEGLNFGKYPICNWDTDVYINWLTQNGANIGLNVASSLIAMGTSAVSGNAIGVVGGVLNLGNTLGSLYRESMIPLQANGNINCGDVITSSGQNDYFFYNMSIKKEYAEIIDNYFTRFGYKVNCLKEPNIIGRTNWNYLEIGSNESVGNGDVPGEYMDTINNICRKGVTIWHNHENIGNFNLSNNII